ncbi:hypothetical protein B0E46_15455 [Rhodanobacter sp. B04]|nr:hypothetical protein B0E46_15455 [Rhodanobacter sp. B04]
MMLPDTRPAMPPTPTFIPTPSTTPPASATVDDDSMSHADYNLRPLEVHRLDHYVEYDDDERFHIR